MPSFFRSADETSTEDSADTNLPDPSEDLSKVRTLDSDPVTERSVVGRKSPPSPEWSPGISREHQTTALSRALLEDKCLREALDDLNGQPNRQLPLTRDHPEVVALARAKLNYM